MKTLFKLLFYAILLAIIYSAGWLAWRTGQPMDAPEFKGLTYYQYRAWTHEEYDKAWADVDMDAYHTKHPRSILDADHCYQNFSVSSTVILLTRPLDVAMKHFLGGEPFPKPLLRGLWGYVEEYEVSILDHNPRKYPACRIPGVIPDDYAISVGAKLPDLAETP